MSFLTIELEQETAWIYLNRPEASNALHIPLIEEFVSQLYELDKNQDIRSIVIGSKAKAFCAGGDIKAMKNKSDMFTGDPVELRRNYGKYIQQIPIFFEQSLKTTIAMIDGAAIGAGFDLAMMCDFRLISERAKFSESFGHLGLLSGDGGAYFLNRVLGTSKTLELSLLGEVIEGEEAFKFGLANRIYDSSQLVDKTREFIKKLHKLPKNTSEMIKSSVYQANESNLKNHLNYARSMQAILQNSTEHLERLK
jgi:enoyl-CoA hydratase/carnithine racemase